MIHKSLIIFVVQHRNSTTSEINVMCDVTITVEDRSFPAHKCILAAASGYFRAMFTVGCKERNEAVVGTICMICVCLYYFLSEIFLDLLRLVSTQKFWKIDNAITYKL